jgi:uncharacterized protein (DUF427 family)
MRPLAGHGRVLGWSDPKEAAMPTPEETRKKIEELKENGYRIDTAIHPRKAVVTWKGTIVAETNRAVVLNESRHGPVLYFPRADARMDLMRRTAHVTHCPFKGDANYFSLVMGDDRAENAVWSYESPIPDVAAIKDLLAFYTKEMRADFGIEIAA